MLLFNRVSISFQPVSLTSATRVHCFLWTSLIPVTVMQPQCARSRETFLDAILMIVQTLIVRHHSSARIPQGLPSVCKYSCMRNAGKNMNLLKLCCVFIIRYDENTTWRKWPTSERFNWMTSMECLSLQLSLRTNGGPCPDLCGHHGLFHRSLYQWRLRYDT